MRTALLTILSITLAPMLAACLDAEVPEDSCGAAAMQDLVGQDEGALAAMSFPVGAVRTIRPGQAITMDYQPARLNIELDADGRIVRVYCG